MKLLLVEDDLKLGAAQKELLEISEFDVVWATDGKEALDDFKTAATDTFDIIILDWMLPEISGLEICKILRSDKYNYQGGIIFVTAKDALDDCLNGLESGADDYIVKPFSPSELVARVKAHINRYQRLTNTTEPNLVIYGDFKLNKDTGEVFLKDKEIVLTKNTVLDVVLEKEIVK